MVQDDGVLGIKAFSTRAWGFSGSELQYKMTQVLGFRAFGEDDTNSERFDG